MSQETLKTFRFLLGLFLVLLMAIPAELAFSSTLSSDLPKMTAAVLQDIDPEGQTAGIHFDNSRTPPERFHGILATPVPELAIMFLLGFILNALWGGTRRVRRN